MRYKCLDQLKVDSGFFHDIADVKCVDIGCTWMSDKAWMVVQSVMSGCPCQRGL